MPAMITSTGFIVKNKTLNVVLLLLPVPLILLTAVLLRSTLPGITATHWSGTRYPDGFTDTSVLITAVLSIAAVGTVLSLLSLKFSAKPLVLLALMFCGSLASWSAAGIFIGSAIPTALAGDPTQAVLGGWIAVGIAATLIALVPLWTCGMYQQYSRKLRGTSIESVQAPAATSEQLERGFDETMNAPVWIWLLSVMMLGLAVFTIVVVGIDSEDPGELAAGIFGSVVMVLAVPLVLALVRVRVRVTDEGLVVSSGLLGFPLRKIGVEDLISVNSEIIEPMQWGGWGWRFFPGGSAVVLKRHEGLALELRGNKRFAVTISDSQRAAALLAAKTKSKDATGR